MLDKINTDGTTVEWFTRSRTLGGRFVGGRYVICIDIVNMQRGTVRFRRFQLYLSVFEGNQSHFSHELNGRNDNNIIPVLSSETREILR